ncbi:MAG: type II secretion system secretin GspD [Desulfobacterales bacterium]|nr:MAG: type II secretion system secretin GspD [Desulfobacterales bacterium]
MNSNRKNVKSMLALTLLLIVTALTAPCGRAQEAAAPEATGKGREQFVSIDFNNVDINVFIKFISELTGTNFIVDQRVKGKVTIISPSKITLQEAYKVFESVLEVHGFTTVKAGEVIKVVPAPEARTMNIETMLRKEALSPEDKVVTQLIPLRYADVDDIKRLFTPMVSKSSVILAYDPTNMLIVTDVYSNISRLLKILKEIDVTGIGQEISFIPLAFADSTKLVNLLNTIFKPTRRPVKGAPEKGVTMVADERTNAIVLLANEVDTLRIKSLIAMIDKEAPRGKGKVHVYYCEHATAEELSKVLQELPTESAGGVQPGKKEAPVVSGKVRINADKATNSLIIMADAADYLVLEEVIKKLDVPRSMVYIESLIMEVNVDRSLDIGIDWTAFGEVNVGGKDALVGGGFSGGVLTPPSLAPSGFSVGLVTEQLQFGDLVVSNIAAIVDAIKTDDDFRILSTPQILTTDNEEARITVGENRPFQTRATTDDSGGTFESFEYRDVGKILKITPHVTEGRLVRMTISLEVTNIDLAASITTGSTLPVTQKRTVDTTVIVKDNHTVVIGGLIDDATTSNESKVPVLGDIPVLGWLFKKTSKSNSKTNLYVFLTPRVIKSPTEADEIFFKKKNQMDTIKQGGIKLYERPPLDKNEKVSKRPKVIDEGYTIQPR